MKAAFVTKVFKKKDVSAELKVLKEIGYQGVEFWPEHLIDVDTDELAGRVRDIGIEVAQICPYFNLTGTQEQLECSYRDAERYLGFARVLGCRQIRTFTGDVPSGKVDGRIYAQCVEALRRICDMGRNEGILFVFETYRNSLTDTGPATLRLLEEVNRPNLKVNPQVPLDYGCEDIFETVKLLGEHTVHLHAHNWVKGGGPKDLTYLGEGKYDFKAFIQALRGKGFDGWISIEHATHNGKRDPMEVARHEIKYLREEILPL